MALEGTMSSISELASEALTHLQDAGAVGDGLSLQEDVLHLDGRPAVVESPP